jgi:CRISPR-associated protein Cmr2
MITYFALTIGPIYKTFSYAQKTRELWAASFTFSHLMECLVQESFSLGDVLIPNMEDKKKDDFNGIGVYPDRLIMTLASTDKLDSEKLVNNALIAFCKNTGIELQDAKKYFQIYTLNITTEELETVLLSDTDLNKSNIHKINHLLNCMELQSNYNSNNLSILPKLFRWKTLQNSYDLSFGNRHYSFKSLTEIASADIVDDSNRILLNKDDNQLNDADKILLAAISFKKYHNYIAILHGDGDNFGKVISKLGNDPEAIKIFSKQLVKFSIQANLVIKAYGASPIYIGGDDIMCFAPVKNSNQTVFHLVNQINQKFLECFPNGQYNGENVSLSYGLSITYIKFPLNEALKKSRDLMFYEAKNKEKNPNKNGIAIELLQHSGQQRKIILNFGKNGSYDTLLNMMDAFNDNMDILHSLIHQFIEDSEMITTLCKNELYEERLKGYFNHHFNLEDVNTEHYAFINAVYSFFITELKSNAFPFSEVAILNTILKANTITRIINFLTANNE